MSNISKTELKDLYVFSIISGILAAITITEWEVGIGMTIYALLNGIIFYLIIRKKRAELNFRALLWLIPIGLLALSFLIRDNDMFHFFNYLVMMLLVGVMTTQLQNRLDVAKGGFEFLGRAAMQLFEPMGDLDKPFSLAKTLNDEKTNSWHTASRVLLGLGLCLPLTAVVLLLLGSADLVFSDMMSVVLQDINVSTFLEFTFDVIAAVLMAIYFFALIFYMFYRNEQKKNESLPQKKQRVESTDLIIFFMLYIALSVVYSIFAYIQVVYLFLGAGELPEGIGYADYARQGFFELLILTFINIAVMLVTINLGRGRIYEQKIHGSSVLKIMMVYLCLLTMLLLTSSFYKMLMYQTAYGLTRMRLLVIIFLAFEAIGLVVTLLFIFKPKTKIVVAYSLICLAFYITVNLVSIDGIIASHNINTFKSTGKIDSYYLSTLSLDAYSSINTLDAIGEEMGVDTTDDTERYRLYHGIGEFKDTEYKQSWQSFNIPGYLASR